MRNANDKAAKKTKSGVKILTFSFDDGTLEDIRVLDILNRYKMKANFFLNSALFGSVFKVMHRGSVVDFRKLGREDISVYDGHEICAHTLTHPSLLTLDDDAVLLEIENDRKALEDLTSKPVRGLAYPGAGVNFSENIRGIVKNKTGIRYARTILDTYGFDFGGDPLLWHPSCEVNDTSVFDLVDEFRKAKPFRPMLLHLWGHSFSFELENSWERFEKLCAELSEIKDVSYLTLGGVYDRFVT